MMVNVKRDAFVCALFTTFLPFDHDHHSTTRLKMAYNQRDWDQGKDQWNEGYSGWNSSESRGHTRYREDEYTGDPKRRKYNDGVCTDQRRFMNDSIDTSQGYQGYSSNNAYDDSGYGGGGHGRHNNQDYDYGYEERPARGGGGGGGGAGGYPKKRLMPSEPSPHVIFLGLDPDFTEADVCGLLCSLPA